MSNCPTHNSNYRKILEHDHDTQPQKLYDPIVHCQVRYRVGQRHGFRHTAKNIQACCGIFEEHMSGTTHTIYLLFTTCVTYNIHPRRCKTSSVGQSAGLLIPRPSIRFQQRLRKRRSQILHGFDPHRPSRKGPRLRYKQ